MIKSFNLNLPLNAKIVKCNLWGVTTPFYKGFVMIFNVDKTAEQYEDVKLFGNGDVGLLDTVNKRFPRIS